MNPDVSDDYFDAAPVADGVAVRMSDNVAATLAHRVGQLARFLETGEADLPPGGLFRRRTTADDIVRRMFPDPYPDRAESDAFRTRHTAALGDSGPARRVAARLSSASQHVLPRAEVEEWLSALSLVRYLASPRGGGVDTPDLIWFTWAQEVLIAALHPDWVAPPG